ncbi:MAG TPA: SRPBCC domain-containing protein, partial [Bryobacteraceae bacterium]|nr:SRPBCC domain-containing protein [Bryobacteraceae bacterium]
MIAPPVSEQGDIAYRLRRRFAARRERVFRAWTDEAALRQWWCPRGWTPADIAIDLRVGGAYRIGMRKTEADKNISVCGRFLEVRSPELLVYTWHWDGAFEEMPETQVTVQFSEEDGGTEVS